MRAPHAMDSRMKPFCVYVNRNFFFNNISSLSAAHETHEKEPSSSATAAPLFFCSFIRYIRRKSMASETTKGKEKDVGERGRERG